MNVSVKERMKCRNNKKEKRNLNGADQREVHHDGKRAKFFRLGTVVKLFRLFLFYSRSFLSPLPDVEFFFLAVNTINLKEEEEMV